MEETMSVASSRTLNPMMHSWDTRARRNVCGAPGVIGSTKHVRDVTCPACLEQLGLPAPASLRVVRR